MAFSHLTNHAATAAARVLSQYQSKPRFMGLLNGVNGLTQEVEDALWAIVAQLDYATAIGSWLDLLGKFVGEGRAGAVDTDYRVFIGGRIAANRSQGRVEDLIATVRTVTSLSTFALRRCSPASVEIILDGYAMAEPVRTRLMQLLRATRAAGVRLMVLYAVDAADTNMFLFSDDDTLQASTTQGAGDDTDPTVGGKLADADAP